MDVVAAEADVLRVGSDTGGALKQLLAKFTLELTLVGPDCGIRGSFWGAPEAGILGCTIYARTDTPVHSVLHEASHLICMSAERRAVVDCNAGGDDLEEAAVCYLQIVLADFLPVVGSHRLMRDMDAWGYSFRLGSTLRWFSEDSADARSWLRAHGLIDDADLPRWILRN